jgi:hypothetical protein
VGSYTSNSPLRLHGVVLSLKKAQGQLYLYFILQFYNFTSSRSWRKIQIRNFGGVCDHENMFYNLKVQMLSLNRVTPKCCELFP